MKRLNRIALAHALRTVFSGIQKNEEPVSVWEKYLDGHAIISDLPWPVWAPFEPYVDGNIDKVIDLVDDFSLSFYSAIYDGLVEVLNEDYYGKFLDRPQG